MESEVEKTKSEEEHMKRASEVARIQQQLKMMEKKWNRTIPKSRPYFELKEKFELQLEVRFWRNNYRKRCRDTFVH